MTEWPSLKTVGWGGSRALPRFRPRVVAGSRAGVAVLWVLLVFESGICSFSTGVLSTVDMVRGRWYPAFANGIESP
jgi:hypothetical protein